MIAGCILSLAGTNVYASSAPMTDYEYGYGPIASLNNDWILAGGYMVVDHDKSRWIILTL